MEAPTVVAVGIACILLAGTAPAVAQTAGGHRPGGLSFGISIGTSTFSSAARGTGDNGEELLFIPYRPTMLGLRVGYGGDALRLEASAATGEPGLAVRGAELPGEIDGAGLLLVSENTYRIRALSAGASVRLLRLRGGPALRGVADATMERWTSPESPPRTVAGGEAGLAVEVALTGSLSARVDGMLGYTPASPFREEDLPAGFLQRAPWRRSLGVGLQWRP